MHAPQPALIDSEEQGDEREPDGDATFVSAARLPFRRRAMRRTHTTRAAWVVALFLLLASCVTPALGRRQEASSKPQAPASRPDSAKASSNKSAAPSASEIAAAKASGKVWVNLDTGIFHKGGRWYGKTKNGKFMTAEEAKKAGYRPAKRD